jgi:hypothetical protein
MCSRATFALASLLALAQASRASAAEGDATTKARCESSYEAGQRLKREERLSAARTQLSICSSACPAALASDCARWLADVDALVPTVRVVARSITGARLDDVVVTMDGQLLTIRLDARPLAVEPGKHVFRFERFGYRGAEVVAEVHAGEREHAVEAVLAESPGGARAAAVPGGDRTTARSAAPSWLLGGGGGVLLLTAGVLLVKGHVDRGDLRSTCYPYCSEADVQPIRTMWLASGILAASGAALIGAAIVLWPRRPHTGTLRLAPHGVALAWTVP